MLNYTFIEDKDNEIEEKLNKLNKLNKSDNSNKIGALNLMSHITAESKQKLK